MKPNEHLLGPGFRGAPSGSRRASARRALFFSGFVLMLGAALLISQPSPREQVGPMPDGGFLLSSGWRIKAAGTQIPVDTFPMATAVTPDKKFLLVLNGGYNPPSVSVIDLAAAKEISRNPVPDGWLGLAISKAGDKVYVGGGAKAAIYEFSLASGVLKPSRMFPIVAEKDIKPEDFIGDVQFSPDGRLLYAANLYRDSVVVVNPASGTVLARFKTRRRPYRILFHPSGKSFYVTSWAEGSVSQYETEPRRTSGDHPGRSPCYRHGLARGRRGTGFQRQRPPVRCRQQHEQRDRARRQ